MGVEERGGTVDGVDIWAREGRGEANIEVERRGRARAESS